MTNERLIRAFICIELPETLKTAIGMIQERLKSQSAKMRWVRPGNIHLTLKFLGDIGESQTPEISQAVSDVGGQFPPFVLLPKGQGVFPQARNPRVLWLGIEDHSGTLGQLQGAIEKRMTRLGFEPEKRAFSPHLTIGRLRPQQKPQDLTTQFLSLDFSADPFQVEQMTLMQSQLTPQGAVYRRLQMFNLFKS